MIVIIAPPLLLDDSSDDFNKSALGKNPQREIRHFKLTHRLRHHRLDEAGDWQGFLRVNCETCEMTDRGLSVKDEIRLKTLSTNIYLPINFHREKRTT
jgi:hypothetical protein